MENTPSLEIHNYRHDPGGKKVSNVQKHSMTATHAAVPALSQHEP